MTRIKRAAGRAAAFLKRETVLSAALFLAVVSSCFVRPDERFLRYIDYRTLALLFCLMAVMAGLQKIGLFAALARGMLRRVRGVKSLTFLLVMLCFFSSMLITNDVALITFVPFTFTVLEMVEEGEKDALAVRVVVMQTIAANLGSMLTPIGNPQNLYLHSLSGMSVGAFVLLMWPYAALSFLLLAVWILARKGDGAVVIRFSGGAEAVDRTKAAIYLAAFVLCLLTVARLLDYRLAFCLVTLLVLASDYKVLARVDYTLLATFAAFFVFIGNMGRVPAFSGCLQRIIVGRECLTAVLASQLISNVPAALLLSGFTDRLEPLIVGANLGGLGTLIASMASLISFKLLSQENRALRSKYLLRFTAANVLFLAVLLAAYFALRAL